MDTRHPSIPEDQVVLDWFAGATTSFDEVEPLTRQSHWEGGEVTLALTDIGTFGGDPRAQIVLYATHHDDTLPGRGISLEIDRDDARKLAASLILWANAADDFKEAQE